MIIIIHISIFIIFCVRYSLSLSTRQHSTDLIGQAKMSIWLSRRNKMKGLGSTDAILMFRGLVAARLKVEFTYYRMVSNLEEFVLGEGGCFMFCS